MKASLVCLVLISTGCFRGWTRADTAAQVTFASELAVDWYQTIDVVADCNESNGIVGQCGGGVPLPVYFPGVFAIELAVAAGLPPKWRSWWEGLVVGAEGMTVWHNVASGYWPNSR